MFLLLGWKVRMSDLKTCIELNHTLDQTEEKLVASLNLLKEIRYQNNMLIEHFSNNTNIVCCDFNQHKLLKNN